MAKCDSYFQHGLEFRCYSTEHPAECSCGGDTSKCDFFPEKRNPKPMDELKACPCCHGKAGYATEQYYGTTYVAVECDSCGLQTRDFTGETAWEDATEAWNRRAEEDGK